jgi:hypothetical protein
MNLEVFKILKCSRFLKCSQIFEKSYSMRAKFYGPHRKGEEVYNTKKRKEGEKKE